MNSNSNLTPYNPRSFSHLNDDLMIDKSMQPADMSPDPKNQSINIDYFESQLKEKDRQIMNLNL